MEIISWDIKGTLETRNVMEAAKLSKLSCACRGGCMVCSAPPSSPLTAICTPGDYHVLPPMHEASGCEITTLEPLVRGLPTDTHIHQYTHQHICAPLHTRRHTNTHASKATEWSVVMFTVVIEMSGTCATSAVKFLHHLSLWTSVIIIRNRLVPLGCWVDNYCTLRVKSLYRNVIHCKLCVNTTSHFHDPLHHFLRRGNSSPTMHPCPLVSGHLLGAQSLTTAAVMAKGALSSATCPHLVIKAYTTLFLGSWPSCRTPVVSLHK